MEKSCSKSGCGKGYTFTQEQQNPSAHMPENYMVAEKTRPFAASQPASITSQLLSVCVFVNQDGMLHGQTRNPACIDIPITNQKLGASDIV